MPHDDPYTPEHVGIKLLVVATFGWLAAWLFLRWTFVVWVMMLGVYTSMLAVAGLTSAAGYRPAPEWTSRFFRTAGWLVLSGVLALVLLIVTVVGLYAWIGRLVWRP